MFNKISQYYEENIKHPTDSFTIAGVSYYRDNCSKVKVGDVLQVIPEPIHKVDKDALKVIDKDGDQLGYIGKNDKYRIKKSNVELEVIHTTYHKKWYGIRVLIK